MTVQVETIYQVLNDVYGESSFNQSVNNWLAQRIVEEHENGRTYKWGIRAFNFDELVNLIWMNYSGGTTAEYAAKKIVAATGMEFKEDVKF